MKYLLPLFAFLALNACSSKPTQPVEDTTAPIQAEMTDSSANVVEEAPPVEQPVKKKAKKGSKKAKSKKQKIK